MRHRALVPLGLTALVLSCYIGQDEPNASATIAESGTGDDDGSSASASGSATANDSGASNTNGDGSTASVGDSGVETSTDASASASDTLTTADGGNTAGDTTTGVGDTGNASADSGGDGSAQQLCVDTINMYRAMLGLTPYDRWTDAEMCSDGEAQSDSQTGTPHGAFGSCGEWAQNECPGWPAPPEGMIESCLAAMWAEGPGEPFSEHGHYINMSSTQYTKVACGFYTTPQGDVWAVQNFQ